jgi:hypothetical protein
MTGDKETDDLAREVAALRAQVETLNRHRYLRVMNSLPRMLAYSFARGLAVGLGTVLGASVLLSVLVWALSTINFIPVIGEWATQIVNEINSNR